jgi:hypothetical protein
MTLPIPSNIPLNSILDFHRNDLVNPPTAPVVVENLKAIDPRTALNMPMPVVDSSAGAALQDALNANVKTLQLGIPATEPSAEQAVFLEISTMLGAQAGQAGAAPANVQSLLSQSLNKLDSLGSAALGQLLSDILAADVPELGKQIKTEAKNNASHNVIVNWPGSDASLAVSENPKIAMNVLYQNLQNSGIFAADQLKKILLPAVDGKSEQLSDAGSLESHISQLVLQLSQDSPSVRDSVKLLLRGDLLWQGQLMPNVQARLYREDAWESDPNQAGQLQKGSRLTMELNLPHLGPIKVVGLQFGKSLHVSIESSAATQAVFSSDFDNLMAQMREQVDPDAMVSLAQKASG